MNELELLNGLRKELLRIADQLVDDKAFDGLLTHEYQERIKNSISRLAKAGDLTVALLGRQGVGKSTLGNAMLGKRVFPNGEGETTIAPVVAHWAVSGEERIVVSFDGDQTRTCSGFEYTTVERYATSDGNPCNIDRVIRVDVYVDCEFLQLGFALADLPGTGFFENQHESTTRDFVREVSLGLFVCSTSPTLGATECQFLKEVWTQIPHLVFVQNHRNEADLDDAFDDNLARIEQIAQEVLYSAFNRGDGSQDRKPVKPDLLLIDVLDAWNKVTSVDQTLTTELSKIRERLSSELSKGTGLSLLMLNGVDLKESIQLALDVAGTRCRFLSNQEFPIVEDESDQQESSIVWNITALEEGFNSLTQLREEWSAKKTSFMSSCEELIAEFEWTVLGNAEEKTAEEDADGEKGTLLEVEDEVVKLIESGKLTVQETQDTVKAKLENAVTPAREELMQSYSKSIESFVTDATSIEAKVLHISGKITSSELSTGLQVMDEKAHNAGTQLAIGAGGAGVLGAIAAVKGVASGGGLAGMAGAAFGAVNPMVWVGAIGYVAVAAIRFVGIRGQLRARQVQQVHEHFTKSRGHIRNLSNSIRQDAASMESIIDQPLNATFDQEKDKMDSLAALIELKQEERDQQLGVWNDRSESLQTAVNKLELVLKKL